MNENIDELLERMTTAVERIADVLELGTIHIVHDETMLKSGSGPTIREFQYAANVAKKSQKNAEKIHQEDVRLNRGLSRGFSV